MSDEQSARFTQLFEKLVLEEPNNLIRSSDHHLTSGERRELLSLVDRMDIHHMISCKESRGGVACQPRQMDYYLYDFPVDPVESVKQVIAYKKDYLLERGVTEVTIGRAKRDSFSVNGKVLIYSDPCHYFVRKREGDQRYIVKYYFDPAFGFKFTGNRKDLVSEIARISLPSLEVHPLGGNARPDHPGGLSRPRPPAVDPDEPTDES